MCFYISTTPFPITLGHYKHMNLEQLSHVTKILTYITGKSTNLPQWVDLHSSFTDVGQLFKTIMLVMDSDPSVNSLGQTFVLLNNKITQSWIFWVMDPNANSHQYLMAKYATFSSKGPGIHEMCRSIKWCDRMRAIIIKTRITGPRCRIAHVLTYLLNSHKS